MTTSIRSRATALAAVAGLSAITLLALAPTASASHGGRQVIKSGSCTGTSDWKLKVKTDDGRLESEYEVDSNRAGQVWAYKVLDNGVVLRSGHARTTAPSGSFEIKKLSSDRAGLDHFVARAHNLTTGERCTGALTF